MTTHPILFSAPMIRALLDGRKTQTRRVIKKVGNNNHIDYKNQILRRTLSTHVLEAPKLGICPHGQIGDLLWVRETWSHDADSLESLRAEFEDIMPPQFPHGPYYRADGIHENTGLKWKPCIFMPRWASRLTLRVADVHVERVQEISQTDAISEGLVVDSAGHAAPVDDDICWTSPRSAYRMLWDSINEKRGYGWAGNPWVWVIGFEVIHKNIDEVNV